MINHVAILKLLRNGDYKVDLEEGVVHSGKTGKPLYVKTNGGSHRGKGAEYPRVWVYSEGKRRCVPVSNIVWMCGADQIIPAGFEIHHKDGNAEHNWWDNLFCLAKPDHKKLHNGHKLIDDDSNESTDTPF